MLAASVAPGWGQHRDWLLSEPCLAGSSTGAPLQQCSPNFLRDSAYASTITHIVQTTFLFLYILLKNRHVATWASGEAALLSCGLSRWASGGSPWAQGVPLEGRVLSWSPMGGAPSQPASIFLRTPFPLLHPSELPPQSPGVPLMPCATVQSLMKTCPGTFPLAPGCQGSS